MNPRRKLIEVALPLEANQRGIGAGRSRSGTGILPRCIFGGRGGRWRPCRAVLFAQLVDDPSAVPEEFPDEAAQKTERRKLFRIIEALVRWENSNNQRVIGAARREIARFRGPWLGRGDNPQGRPKSMPSSLRKPRRWSIPSAAAAPSRWRRSGLAYGPTART